MSSLSTDMLGPRMQELLSARFVIVTGKGGTGKTTLAAALAQVAASLGKRVLLAEVGPEPEARSPLRAALGEEGQAGSIEPVPAGPNLWTVLLTPEAGHRAFLRDVLPLGFLADRAMKAEPLRRFLSAAPAFAELGILYRGLQLVRAEQKKHVPLYDLVVLDAPATGHALAFASLPQVLLRIIPGGPIGRAAREGIALLHDPKHTRAVVTTLPESLPVTEALELAKGLAQSNLTVHGVVANLVPHDPFTPAERSALSNWTRTLPMLGARTLQRLERARAALARLEAAVGSVLMVPERETRGRELVSAIAHDLAQAR
ncbi:MAG: arsenic transporter [Deltaproteobacteria bacterium]|nr:arsenic transporter [Deltaproteobacteria bacterium]